MNDTSNSLDQGYGPSNRWWMLSLVALAYFVLIQHRQLVGYVQVPLSKELGLDKLQSGMLDTAFLIPYGISQLFVAYLSDRWQRRRVLTSSLIASSLSLFAMGFANGFGQLVALRITLGFAQSASVPAIAGVMADCFTPRNRSTAIGIYNLSLNLAVIVVGTMGGGLADMPSMSLPLEFLGSQEISGWRMAMLFFALVGAAASLLIGIVMVEPKRTDRDSASGLGTGGAALLVTIGSVVKARSFLMLALGFVGFCIVDNAQNFWLPRYYVEEFGMTNKAAGFFATIWIGPRTDGTPPSRSLQGSRLDAGRSPDGGLRNLHRPLRFAFKRRGATSDGLRFRVGKNYTRIVRHPPCPKRKRSSTLRTSTSASMAIQAPVTPIRTRSVPGI